MFVSAGCHIISSSLGSCIIHLPINRVVSYVADKSVHCVNFITLNTAVRNGATSYEYNLELLIPHLTTGLPTGTVTQSWRLSPGDICWCYQQAYPAIVFDQHSGRHCDRQKQSSVTRQCWKTLDHERKLAQILNSHILIFSVWSADYFTLHNIYA